MVKKILLLLGIALLLFLSFILINTLRYPSRLKTHTASPLPLLSDSAVQHLSEAIRIKTISYADSSLTDTLQFVAFRSFIERTYPLVHSRLSRQIFNRYSYMYIWPGKNKALPPYVLMAHTDVVPVEPATEQQWTAQPYSGEVKDSAVWGRGSVDDKGCVIAILEVAEQLLKENYQPERTVYLCFGHDEEVSGAKGAGAISKWFKETNIKPALVLDEGGEITYENFKDLNRPIAVLGVAEKGYASFRLTVDKPGGHSSMPESNTAIDILAKALYKLRSTGMQPVITAPVQELFNHIGPGLPFMQRMALANFWLFKPLMLGQVSKTKEGNAMVHTTIVPTILSAGIKDNVIPGHAEAIVNSRILPGQTIRDVEEFIKKAVDNTAVKVENIQQFAVEPSAGNAYNSDAYKKIESIVYKEIPNVVVTPFLLIGATDSRYFRNISDGVINFVPYTDMKGFHGANEKLPLKDYQQMIYFYRLVFTT